MRILWLNAGLLVPLDKGGKLRTWHLLRHLADRHEVTYLGFASAPSASDVRAQMAEVCARLETVPRAEAPRGSVRFYVEAAQGALDRRPVAVARYRSRAYRRKVRRLLAQERFDLLVCDFLPPAVNLPAHVPCPSVLFTHNVEAEIWRRHAETASGPAWRWLMRREWRRMRRFEARTLRRFGAILAVSEADRETLTRLYPAAAARGVHVIPTGVDTRYFAPAGPDGVVPGRLVFTGSMDWMPNEDAVQYFCRDVLPRIRRNAPAVSISVVGRAPSAAVRRLAADPGIQVTGRVEDVRPHIAEAAVYIVPLRVGGGTRLKIFEAMAMGKAVVSTTIGAEGLPVTDGRNIVLADHPDAFAAAVVRLLDQASDRRRLGDAGRALVAERYDWAVVARDLERALVAAANGPRAVENRDPISSESTERALT